MANTNPLKLSCCFQDGQDEKIFVIEPCEEDKVAILEFAVKTLLANQGYQALSFNFGLYVNDPKENKPMESAEEISKYFDKPLVQDQIHILRIFRKLLFASCNSDKIANFYVSSWFGNALLSMYKITCNCAIMNDIKTY